MSPGVAPFGCCHKQLPACWAGDRKTVRRADRGLVCAQPAGRSRSQYWVHEVSAVAPSWLQLVELKGTVSVLALFVCSC